MAKVEIYSAQVCPFAQRSRLTLLEKGVDFEVIEIDLNHKPDWFQSVSPYLKVPVVKVGDDPASATYVGGKESDASQVGMASRVHRFPAGVTRQTLADLVAPCAGPAPSWPSPW